MIKHEYFMRKALSLALKAKGKTSPNPLVGALLVRNGKIIAGGYHKKCGAPHAEIMALDKAGSKAKGANLYVTLEPCTHFGRTPPCVNRIIKSGISRVIIGMIDPNPRNNGKGIKFLKKHRIKVEVGFLENELKKINTPFIKYITKRLPFVTVKAGESLDGKIATKDGDSKWITSDASRKLSHGLRSDYDAIMVGVNTIIRDNPLLISPAKEKSLTRIVVDSQLGTPSNANIFNKPYPVILACLRESAGQETENRRLLSQKAKILEVKEHQGQINLHDLLKKLAHLEITNILVEGGGTLIGSLFDEGLVDRVMFFISPKIIGGKDAITSVEGKGVLRIDKAIRLKDVKFRRIGGDFLVAGDVK